MIADMLQRNVDIRHDAPRRSNLIDQCFVDVHWIEVHQADPVEAIHLLEESEDLRSRAKAQAEYAGLLTSLGRFSEALALQVAENEARVDPHPVDTAVSYQMLVQDGGMSQAEIARVDGLKLAADIVEQAVETRQRVLRA